MSNMNDDQPMTPEQAYDKWLSDFGTMTESVDLSQRSTQRIRLYLDDVRKCPVGWTVARSFNEAVALMKMWHVSEMSLDHDLGACKNCLRADEALILCDHIKSGYDFVCWMKRTGVWPETKPVVHSMNASGAMRMREDIERNFPKS